MEISAAKASISLSLLTSPSPGPHRVLVILRVWYASLASLTSWGKHCKHIKYGTRSSRSSPRCPWIEQAADYAKVSRIFTSLSRHLENCQEMSHIFCSVCVYAAHHIVCVPPQALLPRPHRLGGDFNHSMNPPRWQLGTLLCKCRAPKAVIEGHLILNIPSLRKLKLSSPYHGLCPPRQPGSFASSPPSQGCCNGPDFKHRLICRVFSVSA